MSCTNTCYLPVAHKKWAERTNKTSSCWSSSKYFNIPLEVFSWFSFAFMPCCVALSLPNLKATSFVLYIIWHTTAPVYQQWEMEERNSDILTVRIHFKVWQRANRWTAGRQIKQGPSQQVVLGQIGCDSVQPHDTRKTGQNSQAVTGPFPIHIFCCLTFKWETVKYKASAHIQLVPNTIYLHLADRCMRLQAVVFHLVSCHHWDKPFILHHPPESLHLDKGWRPSVFISNSS